MKTKELNGLTYLYPEDGKKLKLLNDDYLFSVVILCKNDSLDNYEEVDELWKPDNDDKELMQPPDLQPDYDGKISYDDALKLVEVINTMQSKMVKLQESNEILKGCILEMSEVVYDN